MTIYSYVQFSIAACPWRRGSRARENQSARMPQAALAAFVRRPAGVLRGAAVGGGPCDVEGPSSSDSGRSLRIDRN